VDHEPTANAREFFNKLLDLSRDDAAAEERRLMVSEGAKIQGDPKIAPSWPDEVYRVLKQAGVRQVGIVPDAGHSRLIHAFDEDPETRLVTLTTEEEGVAMLAGAWLGGERGVLLLQSSGVGNCINMLSLPMICRMPLVMLVTMRGEWGEFNPWQIPMGQGTRASLEAMGVIVTRADEPHLVASVVSGAVNLAFNTWRPAAVLIGQRVLGAKNFKELARK
jgi:sulfopyruvate decarboxylase alpha subunit